MALAQGYTHSPDERTALDLVGLLPPGPEGLSNHKGTCQALEVPSKEGEKVKPPPSETANTAAM